MMERRPPIDRILDRIEVWMPSEDWLWMGGLDGWGYGQISIQRPDGSGRSRGSAAKVHLLTYEHFVGPIPEGYEVHHDCRVKACCCPWHLVAMPIAEHRALHAAEIAECKRGHPFDEANTYVRPDGHRRCRACHRARRSRE